MADDPDDDPTRDRATSTGYRLAPTVVASPREQRYVRGEEVARGGLGRVAIAIDQKLQRRVALKELPAATAASFAREALVTARLSHPGIIAVFDSGTSETGEPYLVLPFLDGTTLADQIASRGALEARLGLLPNLLAVADALGYAHAEGVVHRDIKPANIMIGAHGETVVLDWGVAHDMRASDGGLAFVGTPRFTSVEQARGEPPVPAFDVYGLGATIATVLTGEPPFAGIASEVALARLRAGETGVPALPAGVAPDLVSIVAKATAPLAERYPHAGAVADDLRRFIAGQLVSARRYTTRELIARWIRRHRGWVAAGAGVLALAAIAAVAIIRQRDRAIREREAAVARELDLVWLQARSHVRTDPTTTLAWLKAYPTSAPHQDEMLALVDEALGRGVARHVWHPPSTPIDATFADDDALIVALRDRSIVRIDPVSGARSQLATLPHVPSFVRARGRDVFAVDEVGDVWRAGAVAKLGSIEPCTRTTGLYFGPDGSLEVACAGDHARWIGRPPPDLSRYVQIDDEHDGGVALGVTAAGDVELATSPPRPIGHFAPHVWVRGSVDGSHYVAVEPRADDTVAIWLGDANGTPPVELARGAACKPGGNHELHAEPSGDGRTVVVLRCGALTVYDAHRAIEMPEPERVFQFAFSPDGRSLIVGRDDGFDVVDVAAGTGRRLDAGSTTRLVGVAAGSHVMFSTGSEPGVRVWSLAPPDPRAGRIGDAAAPIALATVGEDRLALRRDLGCALWDVRRRAIVATTPAAATRAVWPVDAADDGTTCMFSGDAGVLEVVDTRGGNHVLHARTCALAGDGAAAWCLRGAELVEIEVASGRDLSSRTVAGRVVGLTRYHGAPVALVSDAAGCRLETARGVGLVAFDGERECSLLGTAGASQPGRETAIVVAVAGGQIAVWNELGVTRVSSSIGRVEVGPGLAAALDEDAITVWDLRTHLRVAGPPPHARAVERAAWSRRGILASSDDEIVQLWEAASGRTRIVVAPHVSSLAWSLDGTTLYTTDGRAIQAWPVELASATDVRARVEQATTAQIRGDRAETP